MTILSIIKIYSFYDCDTFTMQKIKEISPKGNIFINHWKSLKKIDKNDWLINSNYQQHFLVKSKQENYELNSNNAMIEAKFKNSWIHLELSTFCFCFSPTFPRKFKLNKTISICTHSNPIYRIFVYRGIRFVCSFVYLPVPLFVCLAVG